MDDDADGWLDALKVVFDEDMYDDSFTAATGFTIDSGLVFTGSLFSPTNPDETDVAYDNTLYLGLVENSTNTALVPDVLIDNATVLLTDYPGNHTDDHNSGAIGEIDGASPTIFMAETMDSDSDGTIDMMKVTLTEAVTDNTFASSSWTISDTSDIAQPLESPAGDVADDNIIFIGITPTTTQDTDLDTQVYDITVTGGSLEDQAATPLTIANVASGDITETDGAPPAVISTTIADSDTDGKLNTISFTFSEDLVGSGEIADWTLLASDGIADLMDGVADSDFSVSGTGLTITLGDATGTTGPATYTYSLAGSDNLRDAAGNETLAIAAATTTDTVPPVIVDAYSTAQISSDNLPALATITIVFSEDVTIVDTDIDQLDFTTTNGSWHGGATVEYDDAATSTIDATLTAGTTSADWATGATINRSAGALQNLNSIEDAAGNDAVQNAVYNSPIRNLTVNPYITSIVTMDDDGDGMLDALKVTLSEEVDDSSFTDANGWSGTGGITFSGSLLSPTSETDVTDDNIIYVGLTETVQNTDVVPDVTTTLAVVLTDIGGNPLADTASGDVTETDGAAPYLAQTSISYTDSDGGTAKVGDQIDVFVTGAPSDTSSVVFTSAGTGDVLYDLTINDALEAFNDAGTGADSAGGDFEWTARFYVASSTLVTGTGTDTASFGIEVKLTDSSGFTFSTTSVTNVLNADNILPTFAESDISYTDANGGVAKIEDEIDVFVQNMPTDTASVAFTNAVEGDVLYDIATNTAVAFNDAGTDPDTGADNIWSGRFGVASAAQVTGTGTDTTTFGLEVVVTDDAGNTYTATSSTNLLNVDNLPPEVAAADIVPTDNNGGIAVVSDEIDVVVQNAPTDTTSVVFTSADMDDVLYDIATGTIYSFIDDGSGADSAGGDDEWTARFGIASYTLVTGSGTDTATFLVEVTLTDDAGNTSTATSTTGLNVDNILPTIASADIIATDNNGGTAKISDEVDVVVKNAPTDTASVVFTSADEGDVLYDIATGTIYSFIDDGSGADALGADATWTARFGVASDALVTGSGTDTATFLIEITLTDDAGYTVTATSTAALDVDNIPPSFAETDITLAISGDFGTAAVAGVSDEVDVFVDTGATDIASVVFTSADEADIIYDVATGMMVAFNNAAAAPDVSAVDNIWSGRFGVASDALVTGSGTDTTTFGIEVYVTDDAGNTYTATSSTNLLDVDNIPPSFAETDITLAISGDFGTGGVAGVSDEVDVFVNTGATDIGSVVFTSADEADVLYDVATGMMVAFNDGGTAPDAAAVDNTWSARFGVASDALVTGSGTDTTTFPIEVFVTDDAGNTYTATSSTNLLNADNIVPSFAETDITLAISTDNGTGGIAGISDEVDVFVDTGATDIGSVVFTSSTEADVLYDVATGMMVAFNNAAAAPDVSAVDNIWSARFGVASDAQVGGTGTDTTTFGIEVYVTDDAGNTYTATSSTNVLNVDNIPPTVASGDITATDLNGGTAKISDDIDVFVANTPTDTDSVVFTSADEADVLYDVATGMVVAFNNAGTAPDVSGVDAIWSGRFGVASDAQVTGSGTDTAAFLIEITLADDAGNIVTATSTAGLDVDNIPPIIAETDITRAYSLDLGTANVAGVSDEVDVFVNTAAAADTIGNVAFTNLDEADVLYDVATDTLVAFNDTAAAPDAAVDGIWSARFAVASGSQVTGSGTDTATFGVEVVLTDDAGNTYTATSTTNTIDVDNLPPNFAETAISLAISGDFGTGGIAGISDEVDVFVDTGATDIGSVVFTSATEADVLYDVATGMMVAFNNAAAAPDVSAVDNIWSARFGVASDAQVGGTGTDTASFGIEVFVTDDAGNTYTATSSTNVLNVDNIPPTVASGDITATDLNGGTAKISDDIDVFVANTPTDTDSVVFTSADEADVLYDVATGMVVAFNNAGTAPDVSGVDAIWSGRFGVASDAQVTGSGTDTAAFLIEITLADDAGNTVTATSTAGLDVDNIPPIIAETAISLTVSTDYGTALVAGVSDEVDVFVDTTAAADTMGSVAFTSADEADVLYDVATDTLVAFNNAGTAPDVSGVDNIWSARFAVASDTQVTGSGTDTATFGVEVVLTDDAGNTYTATSSTNVMDVDNIPPVFAETAISLAISGDFGTGGIAGISDEVDIFVDTTAAADTIGSVVFTSADEADVLYDVATGMMVAFNNAAAAPDVSAVDNIWSGRFGVASDAQVGGAGTDTATFGIEVYVTDDAGNTYTATSSTNVLNVDNIPPTVASGDITATDLNGGTAKISDDIDVFVANTPTDTGSVVFTSADEADVLYDVATGMVVAFNNAGTAPDVSGVDAIWSGRFGVASDAQVTGSGTDTADFLIEIILADDAGNTVTATSTAGLDVDNIPPIIAETAISLTVSTDYGTALVAGVSDEVDVFVDTTAAADTMGSVAFTSADEADVLYDVATDTLVAFNNAGTAPDVSGVDNIWSARFAVASGSQVTGSGTDTATFGVEVVLTDDAGNTYTATSTTNTIDVDNLPPNFAETDISLVISGDFGTGGIAGISDEVDVFVDTGANDIGSVVFTSATEADVLYDVATGMMVSFNNAAAAPDVSAVDNIWSGRFGVASDAQVGGVGTDTTTFGIEVYVTDDAGNTYTATSSTNVLNVDNIPPTVASGDITATDLNGGTAKISDDIDVFVANTPTDTDSVVFTSADEADVLYDVATGMVVAFNNAGTAPDVSGVDAIWSGRFGVASDAQVTGSGTDTAAFLIEITLADDAGNSVTATSTAGLDVDNIPPIIAETAISLTVSTDYGTALVAGVSDEVDVFVDTTAAADTMGNVAFTSADEADVLYDVATDTLVAFNNAGTAPDVSGVDNIWSARFAVASGSQVTGSGTDTATFGVEVVLTDDAGNTYSATSSTNVMDVDNLPPNFAETDISLAISGDFGTGGIAGISDEVDVFVDTGATDIGSVVFTSATEADVLYDVATGMMVAFNNAAAAPDVSAVDNIWSGRFGVASDAQVGGAGTDTTTFGIEVYVTDDAGNTFTATSSTNLLNVDNIPPTVAGADITATDLNGGTAKISDDIDVFVANTPTDTGSVVFTSADEADVLYDVATGMVVAFNNAGTAPDVSGVDAIWSGRFGVASAAQVTGSGTDTAAFLIEITLADDAGNSVSATSTAGLDVDNIPPIIAETAISMTVSTDYGTALVAGVSDEVDVFVDTTAAADTMGNVAFTSADEADVLYDVATDTLVAFNNAGTAPDVSGVDNIWSARFAVASDTQVTGTGTDTATFGVEVVLTDDAGNTYTATSSTNVMDVDNIPPVFAETAISLAISGDFGTGGIAGISDEVDIFVDTTAAADTIGSVVFTSADEADVLYDVATGMMVAFNNAAAAPDVSAVDNIWSGRFGVASDAQVTGTGTDTATFGIEVYVTDDAGNTFTATSSTNLLNVDNIPPTVAGADITATDLNGGTAKISDDIDVFVANTPTDTGSVVFTSADEADVLYDVATGMVVAFNNAGTAPDVSGVDAIWSGRFGVASAAQVTGSGTDTAAFLIEITLADDAGNSVSATSTAGLDVDNLPPTIAETAITLAISTDNGTGGVAGVSDEVDIFVDTAGAADTVSNVAFTSADEGDILYEVATSTLVAFNDAGTAPDAGVDGTWSARIPIASASQVTGSGTDTATFGIEVVLTDDAGNTYSATSTTNTINVDNIPPIIAESDITRTYSTDNGTANVAGVSDEVDVFVDTAAAADTINSVVFTGTAEGDILYDVATDTLVVFNDAGAAPDAGVDGTWSGRFAVASYTQVTGAGTDTAAMGIEVTLTDDAGNTYSATSTTNTINVDNIPPNFAENAISYAISLDNGAGGVAGVSDEVDVFVDTGATDIGSVAFTSTDEADILYDVATDTLVAFNNAGTAPDVSGVDNIWSTRFGVASDTQVTGSGTDTATFPIEVVATDDAGNTFTATSSTNLISVDNIKIVIVDATEFDTDGDGNIDEVLVEFSEPMDDSTVDTAHASQFTLGGTALVDVDTFAGGGSISNNPEDPDVTDDAFITFFTDDATVTGTELKEVTFTENATNFLDDAGNPVATVAAVPVIDKAAPVILSMGTMDDDKDGQVDMYMATLSEIVTDGTFDNTKDSDSIFTLSGTLASPAADSGDDNIIYIGITETATNTGDVGNYTALLGLIDDQATAPVEMEAVAGGDVTETDTAPPVITEVKLGDGDGVITVIFSENVNTPSITRADINTGGTAAKFGTADPTIVPAANSGTMTFTLDTSNTDAVQFAGTDVFNFSGNEAKATDSVNLSLVTNAGAPTVDVSQDTTPPDFLEATLIDKLNIQVTFTEPVDLSTVAAADFLVTDNITPVAVNNVTLDQAATVTLSFLAPFDETTPITVEMAGAGAIDDLAGQELNNTNDTPATVVDQATPSITLVETVDLDVNGYLDAVHIVFDENIDDTFVVAGNFDVQTVVGEAFVSTTNGDGADDNDIYITFTEAGTWTTAATPTLQYTAGSLVDLSGNPLANYGPTDSTDAASPTIWFISTMDSNTDGSIDMMKVTLSEDITDGDFNSGNWTVSNTGAINPVLQSPTGDTGDDNIIYIGITPSTANDTDLLVELYDTTVTGGALQDGVGNTIADAAGGDITETDGAPPVIISTTTSDSDTDGFLNSITFTFSEALTGTGEIADWTLTDEDGVSNLMDGVIDGDITVAGSDVTITLGDATGTTGPATYTYTQAGLNHIRDSVPNETLNVTDTLTDDNAAPVIVAAYSDTPISGGNIQAGTLITITFSEDVIVVTPANVAASDFTVTNGSWHGGATVNYADGATSTITANLVTSTTSSNWTNAATIDRSGGALNVLGSIEDAAGNDAVANGVIDPPISNIGDTTRPSITAIQTMDDDGNGMLDMIEVTLNENVDDTTFTNATGWSNDAGLTFTGALASPAGDTANDNVIYLAITESAYNTGVIPDVTTDATVVLEDLGGGNTLATLTSGAVTETDGASPVIYLISTMDSNNDGAIDMMKATLSENITDGDFNNANWAVSDTGGINALLQSPTGDVGDDNVIYIGITPNVTDDTDLLGELYDTTVTGGALQDAAGNTVKDLAGGDVTETDGASPVIISTSTSDSDADGYLNSITFTFSEALTGTGEIADWTLADEDGVSNLMDGVIDGDIAVVGSDVTITLGDATGTTGPATYTYSLAGLNNIRDSVNNETLAVTDTLVTDTASPTIRAALVMDDNYDGDMDMVRLTLSEHIEDSTYNNTNWAISDTALVAGALAAPTSEADSADDAIIYVGFTPTTTGDTDLTGEVYDVTTTGVSLADAAGNTLVDIATGDLSETDGAHPVVTAISTADDNLDGTIDTMKVELTEAITDADFDSARWSVSDTASVDGLRTPLLNISDTANDSIIYIAITPNATGDTDLVGEVYDTTVTTGQIRDAAGNYVVDAGSGDITETDGAAPAIIGTETSAGTDTATIFFSENVYNNTGAPASPGGDLDTADIVYTDVVQLTRTATSFVATAGTASGTLVLDSTLGFVNDMNVDTVSAAAISIYDDAGNAADVNASATLGDTTPPGIAQVFEYDIDGDGNIDEVAIQFTEFVDDSTIAFTDASQFTVGGVAAINVDDTTDAAGATASNPMDPAVPDDNFITIFTNDITATGTMIQNVEFMTSAGKFQDLAALDLPSQTVITEVDKAAPAYLSSEMLDTDANGLVDGISVLFSEDLQNPGVDTANWTVANVPSAGSLSIVTRPSVRIMYITLTEGAGAEDTAVGSLQFSYDKNTASLKDADNNETPAYPLTTPDDGAAPVIIAAETSEAAGTENGYVDRVSITFSENVTTSAGDGLLDIGDLTSNTLTAESYVSGSGGATLVFDVTNSETAGDWDTDEVPANISYARTGGSLDIKDTSGAATEAVAMSFAGATDGAAPLIVAAETGEATGTENGYVDIIRLTYSEPVTIPAGLRTEYDVSDMPVSTLTAETCNAGGCGSGTEFIEIEVTNSEAAAEYDTSLIPAQIAFTTAADVVEDTSAAGNDAITQTFTSITDGAGPFFDSIILSDSTSASEIYSDALTVDTTMFNMSGTATEMIMAQDVTFASNSTGWVAYSASSTYTFTAAEATRALYVKLRDANGNESITASDEIIIDTTPPSITVVQPNGGEDVPAKTGYTYTITWTASDPNLTATPIDIYLDTDGSLTFPTLVATGLPNSGSYVWDTPELDTSTARIKIIAWDAAGNSNNDTSNGDFVMDSTIPIVTVSDPTPGEEWMGGGSQDIQWTVEDDNMAATGSITILYSTDDWVSSTTIATGLDKDENGGVISATQWWGQYTWNPVDSLTSSATLRVYAQDASGKAGYNIATLSIFLDNTPPNTGSITIVDNLGWTNDSTPEIQLSTLDNATEDMQASDSMRFACTEAQLAAAAWEPYASTTTTFDIETGPGCIVGDGAKDVWVEFKDVAGNIQSTHTSDSTTLETNDLDEVTGLRACTDGTCVSEIDYPPSYSLIPSPYFDWTAPATGPAPYEGYSVGLLENTAPAWATCTVNATNTYIQFTTAEIVSALAGTSGEMTLYVRAVDLAGNCGPNVTLDVNLDSDPPATGTITLENYEYLDATTDPDTYWVKPGSTFNLSVRSYEPVSMDTTNVIFNQDELDNMELYHDWNNGTGIFTENTTGAVFLSPIAGVETEGTGGTAAPAPGGTGYFKYTWVMNPLNTNSTYYVRSRGTDQVGNDSGWSTDALYVNIDATRPTFAITGLGTDYGTTTITVNDQDVFINDTTLAVGGTISDAQSGGYRVDTVTTEGNDAGGALSSSWSSAASGTAATWIDELPSISGHNELRYRGLDYVFNVSSSDEGEIGDVDVFIDNAAPISASAALSATSTAASTIDITWTIPNDQGSGTGATDGAVESFGETQDWYRVGSVGVKIIRTNLATLAESTALDWSTTTALNEAGLTADTDYQYDVLTRDNNSEARGTWHNQAATHTFTISTLANPVSIASITPGYSTATGHVLAINVNTNSNVAPTTFEYKMKSPTTSTVTSTDPNYEFTGLTMNTQYCFTVAAVNSEGVKTDESAIVCGNTLDLLDTDPPTFGGVTSVVDPQAGGALDVSWTAGSDPSTPITYLVFVATTSGGQNYGLTPHTTQDTTLRVTALNDGTPFVDGTRYYFVVRAKDDSIAENTDSNTVEKSGVPTRDTVPPSLDLTPAGATIAIDGLVTGVNTVTVSGTTDTDSTVVVTNQLTSATFNATPDGTGAFSVDVTLSAGANVLETVSTDPAGNTATETATVNYDLVPPTATIASPAAGQSVSGTALAISGTASDENGISSYLLEYGPGASPSAWRTIYSGTSAVTNGTLATWDTSTRSGNYTIKLTVTDKAGNTAQASVNFNVSNTTVLSGTIPTGTWTMLAIPGVPLSSNPAAFLGSGNYVIRKWDPTQVADDPILHKYMTEFSIDIADGFWVRPFGSNITYTLTLEVEDTTTAKTVHLDNDWNQVGVPFNRAMLWGDVQVKNTSTGETKSMTNASAAGWLVGGVAYAYSGSSYVQLNTTDRLDPGVGYFIKCGDSSILPSGCDLLFDPGSEQTNGIARIIREPAFDLKLQVSAAAGEVADGDNYIGVVTGAQRGFDGQDRPEPPVIEPYVSVYFQQDGWGRNAGRYANDVRGAFEGTDDWTFYVETDQPGEQMSITFPNFSDTPGHYDITVKDMVSGAVLNPDQTYTYTADVTARAFKVSVTARSVEEEVLTHTVEPGWNLVTIPLDPQQTDARDQLSDDLDNLNIYQFFENEYYDPESEQHVDIQAGIAYWIYSDTQQQIDVSGHTISTGKALSLPLAQGWNLIGNPYTVEIPWGENIQVEYGGETYSLEQAAQAGIIDAQLYQYDETGGYAAVSNANLTPWKGYAVKALIKCNLIFSTE